MTPAWVLPCAGEGRRVGEIGADAIDSGERFGETEIEHLDGAIRPHLDVGGLEITMHDPLLMRRLERVGDLLRDGERLRHG